MTQIPKRLSLAAQAVAILRDDIRSGAWSRWLPGEHQLCARLQISRVTLRAALAQLQREGLLKSRQGQRREIMLETAVESRAAESTLVVLLAPVPLEAMDRFALYWAEELRGRLSEAGYHMEVHHRRACYGARPEPAIETMVHRLDPAGWILYQSTVPMQQWFSKSALPCVLIGSCHAGVRLPSVDLDYRAACRHAGGLFLARGHRHVALLNPDSGLAGDRESEVGFLEATQAPKGPTAEAIVCNHSGTLDDISRHVDILLRRASRPTGLLVSRAQHVLTVLGHLGRRGVRVPQDVSLISRDDESFLQHVVPTVARYFASPTRIANTVSRLVLELLRGGAIPARDHRLIPQFVPGESLAAVPQPPTQGTT